MDKGGREMNKRQRKRYKWVANRCAHNKSCTEEVPYCDYYISRTYFICPLQPKYTHHFLDELQICTSDICDKCKSFTLSRKTMRLARERRDYCRWMNRNYYKIKEQ